MNRTLCIFAKPPHPGTAKTRLAADIGDGPAARIAEAMLMDVIAHCENSGRATRLVMAYTDEREWFQQRLDDCWEYLRQQGKDLGQRMTRAVNALADSDHNATVIIGMDSPQVPVEVLDSAFDAMNTHDAVLGPCEDGGYYLLGARGRWPPDALDHVRWSTPHALDDSLAALRKHDIQATLLAGNYDVDDVDDLRRLVAQMRADPTHGLPHLCRALAELEPGL